MLLIEAFFVTFFMVVLSKDVGFFSPFFNKFGCLKCTSLSRSPDGPWSRRGGDTEVVPARSLWGAGAPQPVVCALPVEREFLGAGTLSVYL